MERYEYIIIGAGAAGLLCALELLRAGKRVLLLEKESAKGNDRTWCFWEKGAGAFDHILHHQWDRINFYGHSAMEDLGLDGYGYKMIRSADFYKDCLEQAQGFDGFELRHETVLSCTETTAEVQIRTDKQNYNSSYVLDSVFREKGDTSQSYYVDQHFGGWFIKSETAEFKANTATLMDFRIEQAGESRFFYVLPVSEYEALVEIAIFSNSVLQPADYDQLIGKYIQEYLQIEDYQLTEKEYGIIPMSVYPYHKASSSRIKKIGTAAGWVKPSSGYAFKRISERAAPFVHALIRDGGRSSVQSKSRHRWFDKVLLKAIDRQYVDGKTIFDSLFTKRSPAEVFRFLDEENSLYEDFRFILGAPILPFSRAALLP